jgi:hypothetical protein
MKKIDFARNDQDLYLLGHWLIGDRSSQPQAAYLHLKRIEI